MKRIDWVLKASKFCNLRCAYCYEWNSLGDRDRIPLESWPRLLGAIRDYHVRLEQRFGRAVQTRLIWHGGEPLALPLDYLDRVMLLQRRLFEGLAHRVLLQTNLFRLSPAKIDLLRRHDVGLGVSLDVIGGIRLDRQGEKSESMVVANLDRLEQLGIPYGAITVVAKHNHRRLRDVHDFWSRRRVDFRVLPLFDGPAERLSGMFQVSDDELVTALSDLFDYWIDRGAEIDVLPLSEWLSNVLRELLGQRFPVYDRRRWGDSVLQVETNGDLFQTDERGRPELRLGNVITESIDDILGSSAYSDSLDRSDQKAARYCHGCRHYGFCNGYPVHAEPLVSTPPHGCPVVAAVHDHIERSLVRTGYDAEALLSMINKPIYSGVATSTSESIPA